MGELAPWLLGPVVTPTQLAVELAKVTAAYTAVIAKAAEESNLLLQWELENLKFEMETSIAEAAGKLSWAPSPQVAPVEYVLPSEVGFVSKEFGPTEDVIIKNVAGAKPRKRGITIKGGRNIRMIGVNVDLSLAGATKTETVVRCEKMAEFFVEGGRFDAGGADLDVFDPNGTVGEPCKKLILQNNWIGGGVSTEESPIHSDGIQPQGNTGLIAVDSCTFQNGYQQGFYSLANKLAGPVLMRRVNAKPPAGVEDFTGFTFWMDALAYVARFHKVYCNPGPHRSFMTQTIRPWEGLEEGGKPIGMITTDGGLTGHFSRLYTKLHGSFIKGDPPTGDYCGRETTLGEGYVSRGYANLAQT